MSWLAVNFPQLQLDSYCQASAASPETRAIVVVEEQRIRQCNAQARAHSIRPMMALSLASALVDEVQLLDYLPGFEAQRLRELARACYQYSADIVLWPPCGLLFDIAPMLKLYGSLTEYLANIAGVFKAQKVQANWALASSTDAAKIFALYTAEEAPELTLFSTCEATTKQRLAALPVTCLNIPAQQIKQLESLGFTQLGELFALLVAHTQRQELARRLGYPLVAYLDALLTSKATKLAYFVEQEYFEQSLMLEQETNLTSVLMFPAKRLLASLEHFLTLRLTRAQSLQVEVLNRLGAVARQQVLHSTEPERSAAHWLSLLRLQWERQGLSQPVMGLRIRCQHTLSDAKQNADLFVREQGRTDAAQLLNRLQAKLGEQNVQRLRAETNHQPERSVSYQSLQQLVQLVPSTLADKLSETSSRRTSKTLPNNSAFTALRPNILLQQPRVLAEAVRIIHGPERLQSGWWGDEVFCRDYFVARNQQQQLLWVYRDPEQTWFVHGLFA